MVTGVPNIQVRPESIAAWIAGKTNDLKTHWRQRNNQWAHDRALLQQMYRPNVPDFPQFVSSEPRYQQRIALDILTARLPRFSIVIHDQEPDEQDRMNQAERFAVGLFRELDRRWRRSGNHPWLRDVAWYTLMGGFAILPLVSKGKDGQTEFHAYLWDPMNVYPDIGPDGFEFLCHEYRTTGADLKKEVAANGWQVDTGRVSDGEYITVTNAFWLEDDGVVNAVLAGDTTILKPPEPDPVFGNRIPVIFGAPTGTPYKNFPNQSEVEDVQHGAFSDWTASWGETFLTPNRRNFVDLDNILSAELSILHRHAYGTKVAKTITGRPKMSPQQARGAELLTLQVGESIDYMNPPTSPRERSELLQYLMGAIQRGGISFVAGGSLGFEISGVTLDQLITATQTVLNPFKQAVEYAVGETLLSLMDQFRNGRFPGVSLETRARRRGPTEGWFIEDFHWRKRVGKGGLPKTSWIDVKLDLALPDTLLTRIQAARAAVGDNRQLMSEQRVHEDILETQDFWMERRKMADDQVNNSVSGLLASELLGLARQEARYREAEDIEAADILAAVARQRLMEFAKAAGGMGMGAAGAAGGGVNGQRIAEASPSVVPPEQSGVSPDQLNKGQPTAARNLLEQRTRNMTPGSPPAARRM